MLFSLFLSVGYPTIRRPKAHGPWSMAKPNFGPEAGRNGDKFQGTISAIVLVPNPHQPLFQNRPNPSFSLPSDWSLLPTFPIPFPIFQWTTTAASSPARGSTEWPTGWAPVWPQPSSLPWNAARASTSAPATWMKMKKKPRIAPSCSPSPSPNTAPISASMSISFPFELLISPTFFAFSSDDFVHK